MNKDSFKSFWTRLQDSLLYKIVHFIFNSAAVALVITAVLFFVQESGERNRSQSIIDNLLEVQRSVSTRYLGIFPGYIKDVNDVLNASEPKDSVIIFEDVLYYGLISSPKEFVKMNQKLLDHVDAGGPTTVVYYNEDGRTFHRSITQEQISPVHYVEMVCERSAQMEQQRAERRGNQEKLSTRKEMMGWFLKQDTLMCEKYFAMTREDNPDGLEKTIQRYLSPELVTGLEEYRPELRRLCEEIDSIKARYLGKRVEEVRFYDFENMYRDITKEIAAVYRRHGIELIPMDEYLTMSCWMAGEKAILAFPSKWSTEEIGLFSQDQAFIKYIKTMLRGVKGAKGAEE